MISPEPDAGQGVAGGMDLGRAGTYPALSAYAPPGAVTHRPGVMILSFLIAIGPLGSALMAEASG